MLHQSIHLIFDDINIRFYTDIDACTNNCVDLTLHPTVGSFVADILEVKDHLCVLNGNRSEHNFHIFNIKTTFMPFHSREESSTCKNMYQVLKEG